MRVYEMKYEDVQPEASFTTLSSPPHLPRVGKRPKVRSAFQPWTQSVMSSDCVEKIVAYLRGGNRNQLGSECPFKDFSGGGGIDGMAKLLAAHVDGVGKCPDGDADDRQSAMKFGIIVGTTKGLSPYDLVSIKMLMELVYEDVTPSFNKGLVLAKELLRGEEGATKGSAGGNIPTEAEAAQIRLAKGMSWHEVVALSCVMHNGTVPSKQEIELAGCGSDPAQSPSAKEHRKNGKPNVHHFLKTKDAKGYREMLIKGATRLGQSGLYPVAASSLMLFIQKLSHMTFDQNMPDLFLVYCEEHMESHKGMGLNTASEPLDMKILTETVLSEKNRTSADNTKALELFEQHASASRRESDALKGKLAHLERMLAQSNLGGGVPGQSGNLPPSETNTCGFCKAPGHFVRDCPKKLARDAANKKQADDAAAALVTSI